MCDHVGGADGRRTRDVLSDLGGGQVEVRIRLSGNDARIAALGLSDWLMREDELRGLVSFERPNIQPGEMGGWLESITVLAGSGSVSAALARSLTVWIRHRRPSVDIEIIGPDGRSVKIAVTDSPDNVTELIGRVVDLGRDSE